MNTNVTRQGNDKSAKDNNTDVNSSKSKNGLVFIIGAISITALLSSAIVYYILASKAEYSPVHVDIQHQIQVLGQVISELQKKNETISQSVALLTNKQSDFSDSLTRLYRERDIDNFDITLSEIEYLLIIAVHRLTLEKDVTTALTALQAADNRLRDISDPRLIEVRQQLTSDINALQAIKLTDVSGLALYLADIIDRVDNLPLKQIWLNAPETSDKTTQARTAREDLPLWKHLINQVWHELRGLVIISREDQETVVPLLPKQRYYLHQTLRLQFDIARLAVLQRDTENFRMSINTSVSWIQKYFNTKNAGVNSILSSLEQMSDIELQPNLPDINSSLETLRAEIKELYREDVLSEYEIE